MTTNSVHPDRQSPVGVDLRVPRPPGVVRRFWARHPKITDALIAFIWWFFAIGFSALVAIIPDIEIRPWEVIVGSLMLTVGAVALFFRRRRPWLVLGVTWVVTIVAAPAMGLPDVALIPIALYALVIYKSVRAGWIGFGISVAAGTIASVLASGLQRREIDPTPPVAAGSGLAQYAITLIIVMLIAVNIRNRRDYVASLIDRAATLVREREQLAKLAALDERSRIAREMHDIVSHSLTVMVTLAEGSAAITSTDPPRAVEGMRLVAESGRTALTDMRRMLGVLSETPNDEQGPALEPQPDIADLPALIERFRSAGLPVRLTTRGRATADPAEQLAIYRIVQESLTNALRHAVGPTTVDVDLRFRRGSTTVTVTNDGAMAPEASPGGHGLVGMRERVALHSGRLVSGPLAGGGWRVEAVLHPDQHASEKATIS